VASGEMSEAECVSFLNNSLRLIAGYSANNSVHYICMDGRHAGDLIAAGKQNYDEFLNKRPTADRTASLVPSLKRIESATSLGSFDHEISIKFSCSAIPRQIHIRTYRGCFLTVKAIEKSAQLSEFGGDVFDQFSSVFCLV